MKEENICDKYKKSFKQKIDKSIKSGEETGFLFCKSDDNIHLQELEGGEGIIAVTNCDKGAEVGWFHTHRRDFIKPSPHDLHASINDKFFCIGIKGSVKCFNSPSKEEIKKYEELEEDILKGNYSERVKKLDKKIKQSTGEERKRYIKKIKPIIKKWNKLFRKQQNLLDVKCQKKWKSLER